MTRMPAADAPANSRRDFLRTGFGMASSVMLPVGLSGCKQRDDSPHDEVLQTFLQPSVLEAKNGLLEVTLKASYFEAEVARANRKELFRVSLRAYSYDDHRPSYSGPTLVVRGGDTLRIKLINDLPVNPPFSAFRDPTNYIKPNTTNLHTHGLHVFPGIYDDSPMLEYGDYVVDPNYGGVMPAGDSRQYVYHIPKDHPEGPFYYHPQYHGSSAIQVASFMSGAILVRGPVDDLPEMSEAAERLFLFQAPYFAVDTLFEDDLGVSPGKLEKLAQLTRHPTGQGLKSMFGSDAFVDTQPVMINGVRQPTILLQAGEVQRWRFINTQVFNYLNLNLDAHVLKQYTTDGWGSALYQDHTDARQKGGDGLLLPPGGRASVIVKMDKPGTYYLRSLSVKMSEGDLPFILPADILAKVVVLATTKSMSVAQEPLPVSRFLSPITDEEFANGGGKKRNIIFRMLGNESLFRAQQPKNALDNVSEKLFSLVAHADDLYQYSKTNIHQQMSALFGSNEQKPVYAPAPKIIKKFDIQPANTLNEIAILDAVEEWTVFNMNSIANVFHIHVNPMYVIKVNGIPVAPYWCDTLALPAGGTVNNPTSITFRMRFKDFCGPFILHSQMLQDSDLGMIQRVTVVPH